MNNKQEIKASWHQIDFKDFTGKLWKYSLVHYSKLKF